jgi:hypothetical protein
MPFFDLIFFQVQHHLQSGKLRERWRNENWSEAVAVDAHTVLRQNKFNHVLVLPKSSDLVKVSQFLTHNLKKHY